MNFVLPLELFLEDNKPDEQPADLSQLDEMIVTDLEAVRALTDQTKMKIIETIGPEPQTVKQIAATLKMVPNNLYYHINQLENFKFIKVASTRVVSGIIEKQYITTARTYTFSRTLMSQTNSNLDAVNEVMNNRILAVVELTGNEVKESLKAGLIGSELKSSMTSLKYDLTQAQVNLIADKFLEFIDSPEFIDKVDHADNTARAYRINFSIFPLAEGEPNPESE